jgi:TRAP-type C4-dicarboxylate transport system permease small subunit
LFSGALAALFMIAIAVLILLSIVTRLLGTYVPGLSDYAGYTMAAASFLALGYTFGAGGHIRVNLVLGRVKGAARRALEIWCLGAGAGLSCYLAWFSIKMVLISLELEDVSEGPDATPLWIPQTAMALGTSILSIALIDRLVAVARVAPVDRVGPAVPE